MTATVFLVRHAAHDRLGKVLCGRMPGVTLGEPGLAEADALAERLRSEPIRAVYSSPLERTLQTAAPIARALGLEVQAADALLELDFGEWAGAQFGVLQDDPRWAVWNTQRAVARPPGGESMGEVQARLNRWLDVVARRHAGETVVAVTHGDVIKAALAEALGLSLDHHDRFEVSPASISVLVAGDWGKKVWSVNEAVR